MRLMGGTARRSNSKGTSGYCSKKRPPPCVVKLRFFEFFWKFLALRQEGLSESATNFDKKQAETIDSVKIYP